MFVNTTMLAGLAGAMLPLVLHLLHRARYQDVQWGAMLFVEGAGKKGDSYARLREWTLLVMRMAMVALLAVALARPVLGSAGAADQPACVVVVLDRSASMGLEEDGRPRIDSARRAVLSILSCLRRGDEAALIYTPDTATPQLTSDVQSLASRASGVRSVSGPADLSSALGGASRLLQSSRSPIQHLFVVCDRQAAGWSEIDELFAVNWRQSVRGGDGTMPRFTVIPLGSDDAGNVAVEAVAVVNPPIVRGVPSEIEVQVTNFGSQDARHLGLALSLATREEMHRGAINIPAGQSVRSRCMVKLPDAASLIVTARVESAGLAADDSMDCALDVVEPIRVLAISGDESGQPMRSESDFVRLALAPHATARQAGADPASLQVVTADQWPDLERSRHQVVMLLNVARLSVGQVRRLEQFVYGGGGLLVAPGNLSRIDDYNSLLWRDGAGILPAELQSPTAADASQATTLLGLELSHPMFRFLQASEDPVPQTTIRRYFPAQTIESSGHVLGRYASGQPYAIEGSYGRGRVVLFTTPLDADWSELPLSSTFLPVLQSAVRYLASSTLPQRNLSPGDTIIANLEDAMEPQAVMERPGQPSIPIDLVPLRRGYEARFTGTSRPGTYRIRYQTAAGSRLSQFVVRPVRDEPDLASLDAAQWESLGSRFGFDRLDNADAQAIGAIVDNSRRRRELWPFMLGCVIALGLGELALTRAWTSSAGGGP